MLYRRSGSVRNLLSTLHYKVTALVFLSFSCAVKRFQLYIFSGLFLRYVHHNITKFLSGVEMTEEKKGKMTVEEAGQKGGTRTSETHGREFYEEIGHKGGEKTSEKHGPEFYRQIGHKGGRKVRELIEKGEESENK